MRDKGIIGPINVFESLGGSHFWLGGSDLNNENVHRWMDGHLVESSYTNWASNEPSNGNEDYIGINQSDGLWFDNKDTYIVKYLCEQGLI